MGNTVGRQNLISDFQKQVIIGCLLGDGRLECRSKSKTARLRIHHGERQKDYLFWKYKILKNIVGCQPKRIVWKDKKRGIVNVSWYFHTLTSKELGKLHQLFYGEGRKILPKNLYDLITPLVLAIWTMDDGDNDTNSIRYSIHSFSRKEQDMLSRLLKDKFRLYSSLNKDRDNYRLRIDKKSRVRLIRLISPFIIPSMRYKILFP